MMADFARDSLDLDDEDRLPWLEPAEGYDEEEGISPLRILAFVVGGLLLVGLIVGIVSLMRGGSGGGDGQVIAAPEGSYKIPATQADAKKFQGEGDASFAASEGVNREAKIDPSRLPEAPVTAVPTAAGNAKISGGDRAAPVARPDTRVVAKVADGTNRTATAPIATSSKSGGAMVQLGAYGSAASAKDAWTKLSRRFDYLGNLPMSVQDVVVGGTTLYRLRASAGSSSNAASLCGRLKVAGESCMVVN